MNKRIPSLDEFINESKQTQYKPDDIIKFKDGEEWIVLNPGMRRPEDRLKDDEVYVKPYNKIAKDRNISLGIDMSLEYIEKNKA